MLLHILLGSVSTSGREERPFSMHVSCLLLKGISEGNGVRNLLSM
jgi:hypothetical protein